MFLTFHKNVVLLYLIIIYIHVVSYLIIYQLNIIENIASKLIN